MNNITDEAIVDEVELVKFSAHCIESVKCAFRFQPLLSAVHGVLAVRAFCQSAVLGVKLMAQHEGRKQ